jgi:hypothetical protein
MESHALIRPHTDDPHRYRTLYHIAMLESTFFAVDRLFSRLFFLFFLRRSSSHNLREVTVLFWFLGYTTHSRFGYECGLRME